MDADVDDMDLATAEISVICKLDLQKLKRKHLQTLCKRFGIKANGKNEKLIVSLEEYYTTLTESSHKDDTETSTQQDVTSTSSATAPPNDSPVEDVQSTETVQEQISNQSNEGTPETTETIEEQNMLNHITEETTKDVEEDSKTEEDVLQTEQCIEEGPTLNRECESRTTEMRTEDPTPSEEDDCNMNCLDDPLLSPNRDKMEIHEFPIDQIHESEPPPVDTENAESIEEGNNNEEQCPQDVESTHEEAVQLAQDVESTLHEEAPTAVCTEPATSSDAQAHVDEKKPDPTKPAVDKTKSRVQSITLQRRQATASKYKKLQDQKKEVRNNKPGSPSNKLKTNPVLRPTNPLAQKKDTSHAASSVSSNSAIAPRVNRSYELLQKKREEEKKKRLEEAKKSEGSGATEKKKKVIDWDKLHEKEFAKMKDIKDYYQHHTQAINHNTTSSTAKPTNNTTSSTKPTNNTTSSTAKPTNNTASSTAKPSVTKVVSKTPGPVKSNRSEVSATPLATRTGPKNGTKVVKRPNTAPNVHKTSAVKKVKQNLEEVEDDEITIKKPRTEVASENVNTENMQTADGNTVGVFI